MLKLILYFFLLFLFPHFPMHAGKRELRRLQTELPEPYRSAKLLRFDPEGWYANGSQMEALCKDNHIDTVVEVGCWLGLSTRHIASLLPPGGKLYAIDHWQGSSEHQYSQKLSKLYDQFLSNVIHARLTDKIVPIRMSSIEASYLIGMMGVMPGLIYLDASHDTESVLADLNAWYPFVKGHGILCGDDWDWSTVRTAVEIFAAEEQLGIEASGVFWRLTE
jgi:hypothetical protein